MRNIHLRIKELANNFCEGNVTKFATKIGLPEANIRHYIAGTMPKYDTIFELVVKLGISAHWLITGEGEMLPETEPKQPEQNRNVFEQGFELVMMNQVLAEKNRLLKEKERVIQILLEKYNPKILGSALNEDIKKLYLDVDYDYFSDKLENK